MAPTFLRSFSTPTLIDDIAAPVDKTVDKTVAEGIVTRTCGSKYGFIESYNLSNIFFHFSELSEEAMALVEPGCRVKFTLTVNQAPSSLGKPMAVKVEVINAHNQLHNVRGVVDRALGPKGFGFIRCTDGKGLESVGSSQSLLYFFPSSHLVVDDESNRRGNTARTGDEVVFDASWNHKYNPPKPIASNVRLLASPSRTLSAPRTIQRSVSVGTKITTLGSNNRDRWSVLNQKEESSHLSMGKASLRTLVEALVKSGKTQYLQIRNSLQKPEYCGRTLTRDERQMVSDILQELLPQDESASKSPSLVMDSMPWQDQAKKAGIRWQNSSRRGLSRTSSLSPEAGESRPPLARTSSISLSDMCRDPSLHSMLSAANARGRAA